MMMMIIINIIIIIISNKISLNLNPEIVFL